jgi:adenylate kinase family enzyme
MKITTPYKFRERLLLMGGGGAGKTTAALSMIAASELPADVIDLDYSMAWDRAIDIDFEEARGFIEVHSTMPDWETAIELLEKLVEQHGDDRDRWLVLDSISPTWDLVQGWYVQLAMGNNIGKHMAELRRDSDSTKEYQAALSETMNWPAVNKEYGRLYRAIMSWKGHLVLTAEAKSIKGERDADQLALYGQVGYKPVGQNRLHHVTSTTLFLQHAKKGYTFTTVKDRNRVEEENKLVEPIDDGGFSVSYLREVAGWQLDRKKVAG